MNTMFLVFLYSNCNFFSLSPFSLSSLKQYFEFLILFILFFLVLKLIFGVFENLQVCFSFQCYNEIPNVLSPGTMKTLKSVSQSGHSCPFGCSYCLSFLLLFILALPPAVLSYYVGILYQKNLALAGVAPWIEHWPMN